MVRVGAYGCIWVEAAVISSYLPLGTRTPHHFPHDPKFWRLASPLGILYTKHFLNGHKRGYLSTKNSQPRNRAPAFVDPRPLWFPGHKPFASGAQHMYWLHRRQCFPACELLFSFAPSNDVLDPYHTCPVPQ